MDKHYERTKMRFGHFRLQAILAILFLLISRLGLFAQCVDMLDTRAGNAPTRTPLKNFTCLATGNPANATVHTITFASAISNVRVFWGEGAPINYAGPTTTVSHTYSGTGIYYYWIKQQGCADTIRGIYINDYNNSVPGIGFITPPAGTANKRCVPEDLTINNASPGMNGFTEFLIDWGDNTTQIIDFRSYLKDITHTYLPDVTGCHVPISVTYQNLCGQAPGGVSPSAIYGEYYFLDYDTAQVTPGGVVLCDTATIVFDENSILNCLDTTNRMVKWVGLTGLSGPLPYPGNNVFRTWNSPANRRLTIPSSLLWPIPADSNYSFRFTIRNICGDDSVEVPIRIRVPATPIIQVQNDSVCPSTNINFRNNTPNPEGLQSYIWDFGDGTILQTNSINVSHSYAVSGDYTVTLSSVINGYNGQVCSKHSTVSVYVKKSVSPFVNVNPLLGCDTATVTIKNASINTQGVVWRGWELGAGVNAGSGVLPTMVNHSRMQVLSTNLSDSTAVVFYKEYGRYTVRLRAQSSGCSVNEDSKMIFLYPKPRIRVRVSDTVICKGQSVTIRDSSRVVQTDQRSLNSTWRNIIWTLDMGDGTIYQSPTPITSNFDNVSATNRLTQHTYANAGLYRVTLTVNTPHSCPITHSFTIRVQEIANPQFTFKRSDCDPSVIYFSNKTQNPTRFRWEILRGTIPFATLNVSDTTTFSQTLPYFQPGDSTVYQVRLSAITGSGQDTCIFTTAYQTVKIPPVPVASFTPSVTDGCSPLNSVSFVNNSTNIPPNSTFEWNFDNGNTYLGENPPNQNYINNGALNRRDTIKLWLITPAGCRYYGFKTIVVYPNPNAQIVAPDSVCSGNKIVFSATGAGIATYLWDFVSVDGTTSTLPTPERQITNTTLLPAVYNVRLSVFSISGCSDSASKTIKINPLPIPNIVVSPTSSCGNTSVTVSANPQGSLLSAYLIYQWGDGSLPDTTTSTLPRQYVFPANTTLNSAVYPFRFSTLSGSGCASTVLAENITIRPQVISGFVVDTNRGCSPLTVRFTNTSAMADNNYQYNIKLMGSSGLGSPFSPNLAGNGFLFTFDNITDTLQKYLVTLTATDDNGAPICTDKYVDTIWVYPTPISGFSFVQILPITGCAPVSVTIKPTGTQGADTLIYALGNGDSIATNNLNDVYYTYQLQGTSNQTYTVNQLVENRFGCKASTARSILIRPQVSAIISSNPTIGCSPLISKFSNTSTVGANSFTWLKNGAPLFFDRNLPDQTFNSLSATDTTHHIFRLVARGESNACIDTSAPIRISVLPKPFSELTLTPASGCAPLQVSINPQGTLGGSIFRYYIKTSTETIYVLDTTIAGLTAYIRTFDNVGLFTLTYNVKVVVAHANGCLDSVVRDVIVNPRIEPNFSLSKIAGCSPLIITALNQTTTLAANQFTWEIGGLTVSNSATGFDYTFTNASHSSIRYDTITLTASNFSFGCPKKISRAIEVYPNPTLDLSLSVNPAQTCAPALVTAHLSNNIGATQFRWHLSDFDTINTTVDSSQQVLITHNGANPSAHIFKVVYTNFYSCSDSVSKQQTILPKIAADFTYSPIVGCNPLSTSFSNTSSVGAKTYVWLKDGSPFHFEKELPIQNFVNPLPNDTTYTHFRLIARGEGNICTDTSAIKTVALLPKPLVELNISPSLGCSPFPVQISSVGTLGGSQFIFYKKKTNESLWVVDTVMNQIGTYTRIIDNNGLTTLTYQYKLLVINPSGCADSSTKTAIANPKIEPNFTIGPDSAGCGPLNVSLTNVTTTQAANLFSWSVNNVPISSSAQGVNYTFNNYNNLNSRVDTIKLTASNLQFGCPKTIYKTVEIYPKPMVEISTATLPNPACSPAMATTNIIQNLGATQFTWFLANQDTVNTTSDTAQSVMLRNQGAIPINKNIKLFYQNNFACIDSAIKSVQIHPEVEANFTQQPDSGCSPLKINWLNASSVGANQVVWSIDGVPLSSSNTTFTQTLTHQGSNPKTVTVQLAARNAISGFCTDTTLRQVTVFPQPAPNLLAAVPSSGCSPLNVTLTVDGGNAFRYIWDFGDGTIIDTSASVLSHTYINTNPNTNRTFTIKAIALTEKGCSDTLTRSITVSPFVGAGIVLADTAGCQPLNVILSAANSVNANRYDWDFGDGSAGSNLFNPQHTFKNLSDTVVIYRVRLTASKLGLACPDTDYMAVTVYPLPKPDFEVSPPGGCGPLSANIAPINDSSFVRNWWVQTNAKTDSLYNRPLGFDTVIGNNSPNMLSVTFGLEEINQYNCRNKAIKDYQIFPEIQAEFIGDSAGCSPFNMAFVNTSVNPNGTYKWNFGNGSVSGEANPISVFVGNATTDTVYKVIMEAVSGFNPLCNKTDTHYIKVYPTPQPIFNIAEGSSIQLPNNTVTLINQTPYREAWDYRWTFGGPDTLTNIDSAFTYQFSFIDEYFSDSVFTIKLLANGIGGCTDSVSRQIIIIPVKPIIDFEPDTQGCLPLKVVFRNKSKYANEYFWTFGDGGTSTDVNPVHVYNTAGTFDVSLKAKGLGGETLLVKNSVVKTFGLPEAAFYVVPAPPRTIKIPEENLNGFVREPQSGYLYEWNMGDGTIYNTLNPVHKYKDPGTYDIWLKVTTPEGCIDQDTVYRAAIAEIGGKILIPNAFVPDKGGPNGGTVSDDAQTNVFYPFTRGVTQIELQIFTRWGELIYESRTVNVGWDGYYRGELCKQDVYVFRIKAWYGNGNFIEKVGDVTLLR